uniref:Tgr2752B n=1 Tax=Dictyostelium purpureum TaxID=5786 RepID=A0A3S9KFY4_DICPU|nr:tgr2752B [Dictyostelium purpureum]
MLLKKFFIFILFILKCNGQCKISNPFDLSFKNTSLFCKNEESIPLLINQTRNFTYQLLDENLASRIPKYYDKNLIQEFGILKTQDIPTVGGKFDVLLFYYAQIYGGEVELPVLEQGKLRFVPEGPFDNGSCVFYTINFIEGCGKGGFNEFSYNYQQPKFNDDAKLIYKTFTITGNNLFGANAIVKNIKTQDYNITTELLNIEHNKIEFDYDQLMYYGNWTVYLDICNSLKIETFNFINKPVIYTWESVDSGKGGIVTLYGKYITTKNNTTPTITIGNQNCIEVTYISTKNPVPMDQEIISCELGPKNESGPLLVQIKFEGEEAIKDNFQYDQPTIFSVIQIKSEIDNDKNLGKFLIKGKKFKSNNIIPVVMVPNNQTYISEFWYGQNTAPINETDIIVDIPLSAFPGYLKLVANRNENSMVESQIFSSFIIEPIITIISSSDTQGSIITISGSSIHAFDFNKTPIDIKVYISENICTDFSNGNGSFITCTAPSGIGKNLPTKIKIPMANYIQNDLTFSYYPPSIISNEQIDKNRIQIIGKNFGNILSGAMISLDNYKDINIVSIDHNLITIDLPETISNIVELKATIGIDPNNNMISQTSNVYNLPIIPYIQNVSNVDCIGGEVTITGLHLNDNMNIYFKHENPNRKPIPCSKIITNTTKLATCVVIGKNGQQGNSTTYTSGKNLKVIGNFEKKDIFVDGKTLFSFNPPTISKCSNTTKELYDKPFEIIITGNNFNRNNLSVTLDDGRIACKSQYILLEFTVISCNLPAFKYWKDYSEQKYNVFKNLTSNITVTVDGQSATHLFYFDLTGADPKFEEGSAVGIIVGVVISGVIAAATIIFISVYKYNRYIRLKTINKILEKTF